MLKAHTWYQTIPKCMSLSIWEQLGDYELLEICRFEPIEKPQHLVFKYFLTYYSVYPQKFIVELHDRIEKK